MKLVSDKEKLQLSALTGLRFIAAVSVAISHGIGLMFKPPLSEMPIVHYLSLGAGFGMTLFFVLSGFVIHYNYAELILKKALAAYLPSIGRDFLGCIRCFFSCC